VQFVVIHVARQPGQVADNTLKKRWHHFPKISVASVATNMKKALAFVITPMLFLLSACGGTTAKVNNLDANGFASDIKNAGVVVLDVRTAGEFASGHIENAINIDVESSDFDSKIAKLDKNVEYAVYCHSGRRSGIATEKMAKSGFTKISNLDGGIQAWQAAGFPLVA
jgi:rhodanese-related sulfurtransferase